MKKPFGATYELVKRADAVEHLVARCDRCGKPAPCSYRKVASRGQLLVGGQESYGACCEACWPVLNTAA